MAMNISRETKLATALQIADMPAGAVNDFFGHYTSTFENSVYLCEKFFGLPGYGEIAAMVEEGKL